MKRALGLGIICLSSLAPLAIVAHAEIYMTDEAAVHSIFPPNSSGGKFERKVITLTPDQIASIEKSSGEKVHTSQLMTFVNAAKDLVFIDQVLGKHELITIAVGMSHDGSVRGIEILEYRETYGSQVRGAEWKKQFVGKNTTSDLKLGSDIKNISGATLSSSHITVGVKRLVRTYDTIRAQL
jgi:Na+-translocating ferredoxin:NAD+ oxidoreductase RnfG subunit